MKYIIQRTEHIEKNHPSVTRFYTGESWVEKRDRAREYPYEFAVSLVTTLSVTVPIYDYEPVAAQA